MKYDYLIVGAGLFGSVFARQMATNNKKVLIIDKRNHIGGNCYTERISGINVHKYGPHIFHTNNERVWRFINQFATFNSFSLRTKVNYQGEIFSFPINLMTLNKLWGVKTPEEANNMLKKKRRADITFPDNLEDWALSRLGEELYEIFIKNYTMKQWGKSPKELPMSILKRLPFRSTFNDRYFNDLYEGIPIGGYTKIFEKLLDHQNIEVQTNVDFFEHKKSLVKDAAKTIYSGKIDEFYDYQFGELEYRSLRFETIAVKQHDFQGNAIINYTGSEVPYTRIVEHKHFEREHHPQTIITYEFPDTYDKSKTPYYPINDDKNNALYQKYQTLVNDRVIFGGRLGKYSYWNMDQTIANALLMAQKEQNAL
jgi:UDP-galactopyranose mutase